LKEEKKGKGKELKEALDDAANQVSKDALGTYRVSEILVQVDNPKISEYRVTITPA
jgi:flavin-binding protein dodecin